MPLLSPIDRSFFACENIFMLPLDLAKLIMLAAIWGGSFIFLRIAVPELGPMLTATLRVGLATLALVGYAAAIGVRMEWRRNLKAYALVGLTAAAVPFASFSYAAQYLPAAYSAVLNSTAPLFGALLSIFWLAERLSLRKASGLLLGMAGVAILMGAGALATNASTLLAAGVCLFAAASYAVSSIIVKLLGREAGHRPIEAAGAGHRLDGMGHAVPAADAAVQLAGSRTVAAWPGAAWRRWRCCRRHWRRPSSFR